MEISSFLTEANLKCIIMLEVDLFDSVWSDSSSKTFVSYSNILKVT